MATWLRRTWYGLAAVAGVVVVLAVGLFVAMSVTNSPVFAWRAVVYGESDIGDFRIFPERAIAAPATPSPLPTGPAWDPGTVAYPYAGAVRSEPISALFDRTKTHAFIIVQNDQVIYEIYPSGASRSDVNTSFSSVKSFVSSLIGAAIADGRIGSVSDPVIKYVPEIAGRGLDALTIRDLLLMNTGIRYIHDSEQPFYMIPFSDDARTYYSPDLRKVALSVVASGTSIGAGFRYNNYHLLLEGLILERVTGMPVAKYLEQQIWQPMGAEFNGSWSLDSDEDGFEKMESGLNARAIDFARFGLVFLHGGEWNGHRILPQAWVDEATQPLEHDERAWEVYAGWPKLGGYYKYHWWGLRNDGGNDFMARGKFGQFIYVAPRKNAVIVRLGDAPDDNVDWALVIRGLVDRLP